MSEPTPPDPATSPTPPAPQHGQQQPAKPGLLQRWQMTPLYLRILGGVVLGVVVGLALGERAGPLGIPSKLVLRLLGALASPLILLAVVQALMHAQVPRGSAWRLFRLLITNTLVAIAIGLLVANLVQPGRWTKLSLPEKAAPSQVSGVEGKSQLADDRQPADGTPADEKSTAVGQPPLSKKKPDALKEFLENIPKSLLGPLGDEGKVLSVIVLAVAFGIALRRMKETKIATVADLVEVSFRTLIVLLHWIIEVIPLAVFGIVASIVGVDGFGAFRGLAAFVVAVLIALALQVTYYLVRIHFGSWARPRDVLRGMRDALVMAFSTGSSTATMPVTYACLREKVGLRERSASLGGLVGSNFNNDGTALYEAMAALFISQAIGQHLDLKHQFMVVLTSIAASVGAAGIPEAGIVTMTLVFDSVGLPREYIPILLAVDWFLDRCRTTVNVMGDVNVSCLLDGRTREERGAAAEDQELAELA